MGAQQSLPSCLSKPLTCDSQTPGVIEESGGHHPVEVVIDPRQAEIAKLCYNAAQGRSDVVKSLLHQGVAKATDVDYDRRSALHIAASEGHADVVKVLLEQKANINAKDRRGSTPLDEAVYAGHKDVRTVLIDAGASSGDGVTPLMTLGLSVGARNTDNTVQSISSALTLGCAAAAGSLPLLQEMQAGGSNIAEADYDGRTALHVAAARGHVDVVQWLIKANVDVDRKDNFGRTAMDEAVKMRHEKVIEALKEAGATAKAGASDGPDNAWGIPKSEIVLGNELSSTLKSVVFHATWRGTRVVCKTARILAADEEGNAAEKELIKEIQLLSTMRHPDLVLFLGACVEHSPPFVITEFMEGGDLERYYRSRQAQSGTPYKPPGRKLLRWASSVARALAFLHESTRPIIHRDLKPLNLLLNGSEELKVTDFGISKLLETNLPGRQRMSGGVGTWRYMAPEVVRCEDYTDRVDVFSYALVLWFMATGQQPYVAELGKDPEEVLRSFIEGKEPRPDAKTMKGPAALRTLTEDCWHVQATSRPSALECTQRLASIVAAYREGPMEAMQRRLSGQ